MRICKGWKIYSLLPAPLIDTICLNALLNVACPVMVAA